MLPFSRTNQQARQLGLLVLLYPQCLEFDRSASGLLLHPPIASGAFTSEAVALSLQRTKTELRSAGWFGGRSVIVRSSRPMSSPAQTRLSRAKVVGGVQA